LFLLLIDEEKSQKPLTTKGTKELHEGHKVSIAIGMKYNVLLCVL